MTTDQACLNTHQQPPSKISGTYYLALHQIQCREFDHAPCLDVDAIIQLALYDNSATP